MPEKAAKRNSTLVIMIILILGLSSITVRGSIGNLTMNISLKPHATTAETSLFDFDFQTELNLSIDISGLALRSEAGLGLSGAEFFIFGLKTTLSALNLDSDFIFASPFNKYGLNLSGGDSSLLFVKKRAKLSIDIAGLKVKNLLIVEDINFPDPSSSTQTDSYSSNDQSFQIGNILTIQGETLSGITFKSILGACADPQKHNRIKKRLFKGEVCTHKNLRGFVEKTILEGITLANTDWSAEVVFQPLEPIEGKIVGKINLLNFVDLRIQMESVNVASLNFKNVVLRLESEYLTIIRERNSEFDETWYWVKIPLKSDFLNIEYQAALTQGEGFTDTLLEAEIKLNPTLSFHTTAVFGNGPPIEYKLTKFRITNEIGYLTLDIGAIFTPSALKEGSIEVNLDF